ncbi:MAG: NYN domain-containing protein [Elainellaceae cyanobacterium]
MVTSIESYPTPIIATLRKLAVKPTVARLVQPVLLGALVGGVSGNPNLGFLSSSAALGLNLLDPTYSRRIEVIRLQEQQAAFERRTSAELNRLRDELKQMKKVVHPRGRVAVFIDGSNLYISARSLNRKIDYEKLLAYCQRGASALTKATFFTGVDPTNLRQRQFFHYLHGLDYPVEIAGGAVVQDGNSLREKGVDTEMALKMVESAGEYDTALLLTGDGDLRGAVQRVRAKGARVEVACFPSVTSRSLREAADEFIDITQLDIFRR